MNYARKLTLDEIHGGGPRWPQGATVALWLPRSASDCGRSARTNASGASRRPSIWTVYELLAYRVPLPAWSPPNRQGRQSRTLKALSVR